MPAEPEDIAAASILVVDDEQAFLDSVARMLRIEGFSNFTTEADPTAVPPMLEARSFDLALLDVTMPGMDGLELLGIIKERSPRTECIMITAHESVPLVIRAMKVGAYDYLVKPVTPEQLDHALRRALEHGQLLKARDRQEQLERELQAAEEANRERLLLEARAREEVLLRLEQAHRELQQAQTRLVQSEKMAAMGQLVAGIAHEINNPLGAVCSSGQTLDRALRKLSDALEQDFPGACETNRRLRTALAAMREANQVISSGSKRVADIVDRLRAFARLDEAELKPMDLREGIEASLSLLSHELSADIGVITELADLPPVLCNPRQLNQVFYNLLLNARQAMEREGQIRISAAPGDGAVTVVVADDGAGIPAADLQRVFDPGFTTRGVGVGAGLGLATCYNIITAHGGEIAITSEPGQGTEVTVVVPLAPHGITGAPGGPAPEDPA